MITKLFLFLYFFIISTLISNASGVTLETAQGVSYPNAWMPYSRSRRSLPQCCPPQDSSCNMVKVSPALLALALANSPRSRPTLLKAVDKKLGLHLTFDAQRQRLAGKMEDEHNAVFLVAAPAPAIRNSQACKRGNGGEPELFLTLTLLEKIHSQNHVHISEEVKPEPVWQTNGLGRALAAAEIDPESDGIIPYIFTQENPNESVGENEKRTFERAFEFIQDVSIVRFKERSAEWYFWEIHYCKDCENTVETFYDPEVGRGSKITFSQNFNPNQHEDLAAGVQVLLKALGFLPTHLRPDREEHVTVHYENIAPANHQAFQPCDLNTTACLTYGTGYDCGSLLHPSPSYLALPQTSSITALSPGECDLGAPKYFMSWSDVEALNRRFGSSFPITGGQGSIKSHDSYKPNDSGNNYEPNSCLSWYIRVREHNAISFSFNDWFKLEPSSSCAYDYVEVIDGNGKVLLEKSCGPYGSSKPQPFVSESSRVRVHFHSDGSSQREGFQLDWTEIDRTDLMSPWSAWSECDGSADESSRTRTCAAPGPAAQTCTAETFQSSACPEPEPACAWDQWEAWAPCLEASGVRSRGRACAGAEGCTCGGSDSELALCDVDGGFGAWSLWSECQPSGEQFRERVCAAPAPKNNGAACTGEAEEMKACPIHGGWAEWGEWAGCGAGSTESDRHRSCTSPPPNSLGRACRGEATQIQLCSEGRPITCSAPAQSLTSPNFNVRDYPQNLNQVYNIQTNASRVINLWFTAFDVEGNTDECNYDFVQLFDASSKPISERICGNGLRRFLTSLSAVSLAFTTDAREERAGWELWWCPQDVVRSPGYPDNYANGLESSQRVSVEPGHVVVLTITDLEIEVHPTCDFDYLMIEDGDGTVLLNKTCGARIPTSEIESHTDSVYIILNTDQMTTRRGYEIRWRQEEKLDK